MRASVSTKLLEEELTRFSSLPASKPLTLGVLTVSFVSSSTVLLSVVGMRTLFSVIMNVGIVLCLGFGKENVSNVFVDVESIFPSFLPILIEDMYYYMSKACTVKYTRCYPQSQI